MPVQHTRIPFADLVFLDDNPRTRTPEGLQRMADDIHADPTFFDNRPVLVNYTEGRYQVYAGDLRAHAAHDVLGWEDIPCNIERDIPSDTMRARAIKDNLHRETWAPDILTSSWASDDLAAWGLTPDTWGGEQPDTPAAGYTATEDDYEPPPEIVTDIVPGDLFEIGPHRLLCGDSTSADDVAKLMDGEKADMVFTDPPYGIDWNTDYTRFTGGLKPSENIYSKIENDQKQFDPTWFLAQFETCLFFGANCFSDKLPKGNWIVWDKRFDNDAAFLADAEVAWYNGSGAVYIIKETHQGFVSSDTKRFHPTQKPVKLFEKIFEKIKAPERLFDPFLGSGTTMVAAHQLHRRCYGMEIDPQYCQVIVDRMLKLDPTLEIKRNGQPYLKTTI